jgi:hypothetical protein
MSDLKRLANYFPDIALHGLLAAGVILVIGYLVA